MSAHLQADGKVVPNLLNPSDVIPSLRDLIVYLHRGNIPSAESIVKKLAGYLNKILRSGASPGTPEMQRAQQTMFAIEEVSTLLAQRDLDGAGSAARDAAKEWKPKPTQNAAP